MAVPVTPTMYEPVPIDPAPHVLVCVAGAKDDLRLMRQGSMLAGQLGARMTVLFVLPSAMDSRPDEAIHAGRVFAEALRVPFVELPAYSVVDGIAEYARDRNVTHVVLGSSRDARWYTFRRETALDELVERLHRIDVYVLSDSSGSHSYWWTADGLAT